MPSIMPPIFLPIMVGPLRPSPDRWHCTQGVHTSGTAFQEHEHSQGRSRRLLRRIRPSRLAREITSAIGHVVIGQRGDHGFHHGRVAYFPLQGLELPIQVRRVFSGELRNSWRRCVTVRAVICHARWLETRRPRCELPPASSRAPRRPLCAPPRPRTRASRSITPKQRRTTQTRPGQASKERTHRTTISLSLSSILTPFKCPQATLRRPLVARCATAETQPPRMTVIASRHVHTLLAYEFTNYPRRVQACAPYTGLHLMLRGAIVICMKGKEHSPAVECSVAHRQSGCSGKPPEEFGRCPIQHIQTTEAAR